MVKEKLLEFEGSYEKLYSEYTINYDEYALQDFEKIKKQMEERFPGTVKVRFDYVDDKYSIFFRNSTLVFSSEEEVVMAYNIYSRGILNGDFKVEESQVEKATCFFNPQNSILYTVEDG